MEKGDIANYEQFLHFPQCFQMTFTADTKKPGLFGKELTIYHTVATFNKPE